MLNLLKQGSTFWQVATHKIISHSLSNLSKILRRYLLYQYHGFTASKVERLFHVRLRQHPRHVYPQRVVHGPVEGVLNLPVHTDDPAVDDGVHLPTVLELCLKERVLYRLGDDRGGSALTHELFDTLRGREEHLLPQAAHGTAEPDLLLTVHLHGLAASGLAFEELLYLFFGGDDGHYCRLSVPDAPDKFRNVLLVLL